MLLAELLLCAEVEQKNRLYQILILGVTVVVSGFADQPLGFFALMFGLEDARCEGA